ncbi:HigA family addiction module antitoxin [Paenibacillus sp. NRS-1782]|uniref:HigA family addiction module antitoxin n=1 Tax=unclassified Paenibacillus TaxID=185978 RepID=UPI003D2A98FB
MGDNQYLAGIAIPPGETLQDVLDDNMMTQKELALRLGCSSKHVNKVIKGTASITSDFALKLEDVLGIPSHFWMNLEVNYQETLSRLNAIPQLKEEEHTLSKLSYSELAKQGWVPATKIAIEQIKNLRSFFGVASLESVPLLQPVAFRKSDHYTSEDYALAAWITKAENKAKEIDSLPFDINKLKGSLGKIKKLTVRPLKASFIELQSICAGFGLNVVVVEHISRTYVNGMTKWLPNNRALIALSVRGGYEDIFWFTFFHEIGHVLQNKKSTTFVDMEEDDLGELEKEADEFALETLLSSQSYKLFVESQSFKEVGKLRDFCRKQSIHPGILVGRLMKDNHVSYGDPVLQKLRTKISK